jgi:ketosteroid isomerase-like protein
MKLLKIPLYIFLMSLIGTAKADDHADIMKLLNNYAAAINGTELNLELAQSLWSHSEEITFIHPRGHQNGWDEIKKEFYLGAMGFFKQRELVLNNIGIQVLTDDTAWAEFYWDFEAVMHNGTPLTTAGRETQILKREGDDWKIIHVHYSGMPTQEEGEGF